MFRLLQVLLLAKAVVVAVGGHEWLWPTPKHPGAAGLVYLYAAVVSSLACLSVLRRSAEASMRGRHPLILQRSSRCTASAALLSLLCQNSEAWDRLGGAQRQQPRRSSGATAREGLARSWAGDSSRQAGDYHPAAALQLARPAAAAAGLLRRCSHCAAAVQLLLQAGTL